ncbi:MAG: hypothetical protein M0Z34_11575 [Nitrospiraceae bacterium]|nr:hypothetical protein [Nitrospiraceae bacterium]
MAKESTTLATIEGWSAEAPGLVGSVEADVWASPGFHTFPEAHAKHIKATNLVEPSNEEITSRPRPCDALHQPGKRPQVDKRAAGGDK